MIYMIAALGLMIIGLYIVMTKQNLIKIIIGLDLFETGIFILLVSIGYIKNGTAPIFSKQNLDPRLMVDPIPQALVLTAIVIGVATLALALSLVIRLYKHYKTLDVRKIKDLKW
jgi:multicomponent Na+:H+ antiporter subunit C